MRNGWREKQRARRRQEQEYRDKVPTLSDYNYSEQNAAKKETKQLVPMLSAETRATVKTAPYELPRIVLPGAAPNPLRLLNILAYGLGVIGLAINAWFAWNKGSVLPDKILLSSLGLTAEAIMFYLPSEASELWRQRKLGGFSFACIVAALLFTFAVTNSLGFASVNLTEAAVIRSERISPSLTDAQRRLETLTNSRKEECIKRGDRCRQLEKDEQIAIEKVQAERDKVSSISDPQITSAANLVSWISLDYLHPTPDDFAQLRLLLLTLLPQLGGLVLMIANRRS